MEYFFGLAIKLKMLPRVLILLMCQTPPWTNQNRIDLESEASQLLHQKGIDFNCKNGFQRGMPFRAVHPPRSSKEKTTTITNRPQNCGRLLVVFFVFFFLKKKGCHLYVYYWCARLHHGPTKTELTWNHKLHSCFIKRASSSIAKMVFKGGCPSELCTPQEAVMKKPPQ